MPFRDGSRKAACCDWLAGCRRRADSMARTVKLTLSSSKVQNIPAFPHILRARRAHLEHGAFRLVDMTAEEVLGLMLLDKIADRAAARV